MSGVRGNEKKMKRNEDILQELKLRRFIRKALRIKYLKEKKDGKESRGGENEHYRKKN